MKLDLAQVRHVAKLARLSLTPEEESKLVTQLSVVLDAVDTLAALDTQDVPPTTFAVTEGGGAVRVDEARDELSVESVLKNAPEKSGDSFTIPQVLDGNG
ncbi:MAG: Asp-tRNA(Asn)/Glu-tRNA(Gln) amidotransferase subunit GatC [Archangium sp.]|nr:Asp-tRNA(Asn)/Glu-tRNA(Gln) amidotransferase subunit GatC [Archangium sp.]